MNPTDEKTKREVSLGLLRVFLGFLQTIGATLTLILFFKTGESQMSYISGALTFAVTATSMLLFRKK